MDTQNCSKCNKKLSLNHKFCTDCGNDLNNTINVKTINHTQIIFWFIVVFLIAIFSFIVFSKQPDNANINLQTDGQLSTNSQKTIPDNSTVGIENKIDMNLQTDNQLSTNPAWRTTPDSFIIDVENKISDLPKDGFSVWVEEVIDENTIKISYIILKGGEQFITFATVNLHLIAEIEDKCKKVLAQQFLKDFIEHKYIYLSGGCRIDNEQKHLTKNLEIIKKDITHPDIINYYVNNNEDDFIDVTHTAISLGYGQGIPGGMPTRLSGGYDCDRNSRMDEFKVQRKFKDIQEVAEVAKRGFWETCNN